MNDMNKTRLFMYVEGLWSELEAAEDLYGKDASFTRHERARWNGAYKALAAAGLMEEYREYQAARVREEIK